MKKKHLVFSIILISTFLIGAFYLYKNFFIKSKADLLVLIKTEGLSQDSVYSSSGSSLIYDIYSTSSYIYKTKEKNELGIIEFIQNKPQYQITADKNEILIPENFLANSVLLKKQLDEEDISIKKINPDLNGIHYYYNQEINGIPVYGSVLSVHLRNEDEVYSVAANLTQDKAVDDQKITEDQAKNIALEKAKKETQNVSLNVEESQKYIFNQGLLGLSSDFKNYNTLAVTIRSDKEDKVYGKTFFVDLASGSIAYEKELIRNALSRTMKDCSSSGSCRTVRTEGAAATGDKDTDTAYENIGDTYNFFFNRFKRDSYNNAGAPYIGNVHVPSSGGVTCPNAFWDGKSMNMCSGMAIKDVTAHELTHAVTQIALKGNEIYESQAGSINESLSDIFGWGVDDANWTMGEGSLIGVIRRLDDPTKSKTPQPDKIFSSYYYCGSPCTRQTDYCGVHQNDGVLNKAFYLMVEGGDFNGCKLAGVGQDKALNITYRVQNTYLQPSSNYRSLYTAFQQACSDLYPSEANTCDEVKKALQAVEMDQQTENTLTGAKCTGGTEKTASCVGSQSGPTNTPTPSLTGNPTATPANQPTSTPAPAPACDGQTHYVPVPLNWGDKTIKELCAPGNAIQGKLCPIAGGAMVDLQESYTHFLVGNCNEPQDNRKVRWEGFNCVCHPPAPTPPPGPECDGVTRFKPVPANWNRTINELCAPGTGIQGKQCAKDGGATVDVNENDVFFVVNSCADPVVENKQNWEGFNCVCRTSTTPTPTGRQTQPTNTPTPLPNSVVLTLKLKFQGITSKPQDQYNKFTVKVRLISKNKEIYDSSADFIADANGIWQGKLSFNEAKENDYTIFVKGPKHIQKKFCDSNPTESNVGSYRCTDRVKLIHLPSGDSSLDFSSVVLLTGDLDPQDGLVNSYDFSLIRNNLSSRETEILKKADLNLDGIIDTQDYALIIQSLSKRYDEED